MTRTWWRSAALAVAIGCASVAWADDPGELREPNEPSESASAPAPAATDSAAPADEAEQTMQDLMQLRQGRPVVDPVRTPSGAVPPAPPEGDPGTAEPGDLPAGASVPTVSVEVDRSVLGVAPGQAQPTLRREGDFVVTRRGRLIRSPDGAHLLFVFEADSPQSPEPPMILQPNQLLESMENIVEQRGSGTVFEVSGQVHTYRGANYLLVTMMNMAVDQGNLQN